MIIIVILALGGSIPVFDEIILSTSLMNKVISIDSAAGKFCHHTFLNFSFSHLPSLIRGAGMSVWLCTGSFGQ